MAFEILPLEQHHVDQAVEVHVNSFPTFFLTFLGPRFLREFYGSFFVDPAGVGFVAVNPETREVIGVVVGAVNPHGYFRRLLKRRWWAFCIASCSAVLRRPTIIRRLFRAVFYRGDAPEGPVRSLLSSIAVSPKAQRTGVGQSLLERWCDEIRRRGSSGCFLTTDAVDNDPVNRFYQKQGYGIESTFETPEGRLMHRYVLDFPPNDDEQKG